MRFAGIYNTLATLVSRFLLCGRIGVEICCYLQCLATLMSRFAAICRMLVALTLKFHPSFKGDLLVFAALCQVFRVTFAGIYNTLATLVSSVCWYLQYSATLNNFNVQLCCYSYHVGSFNVQVSSFCSCSCTVECLKL